MVFVDTNIYGTGFYGFRGVGKFYGTVIYGNIGAYGVRVGTYRFAYGGRLVAICLKPLSGNPDQRLYNN